MDNRNAPARREVLAGLGAVWAAALAGSAQAAGLGGALNGLLGKASDSSLDKLAQPGAFFNDPAIRIGLPVLGKLGSLGGGQTGTPGGLGGVLGSVLGGSGAGGGLLAALTGGLTRSLNDAASAAAGQAKPIFHTAISKLTLNDVPGIVSKTDGATQYLRQSAGSQLTAALRPLIDTALANLGAYRQLDQLGKASSLVASAGLGRSALGKTVTDQALAGIFQYIGGEEARLRANPVGSLGGALGGLGGLLKP